MKQSSPMSRRQTIKFSLDRPSCLFWYFAVSNLDDLCYCSYLEPLAIALDKEKWSLVQFLLSSSYSGYGTSSLRQVIISASYFHVYSDFCHYYRFCTMSEVPVRWCSTEYFHFILFCSSSWQLIRLFHHWFSVEGKSNNLSQLLLFIETCSCICILLKIVLISKEGKT